jgi:hypothetical protein
MLFARSERHAGSRPTRRAFLCSGATFVTAAVATDITTIGAPKRIGSAIATNCPDSMQSRSGAARLAVVGRPIFSTHQRRGARDFATRRARWASMLPLD